jgi:general stress protein 26
MMNVSDISKAMRTLDICMLTTVTKKGLLISRPMSNNRDVEYDGNSYFFTTDDSDMVENISENPAVNLTYVDAVQQLYISVTGKAKLIKKREKLESHWVDELKQWYPQGLDQPGIVMIHVQARRIKYWDKMEEGEVKKLLLSGKK